jgi:uncharacterized membrane protein
MQVRRLLLSSALLLVSCDAPQANGSGDPENESAATGLTAPRSGNAAGDANDGARDEPAGGEQVAEANASDASGDSVSACLLQDGERIAENRLKAVGTEPFWGAEIRGRCVTYSTPENIDGTRIWTTFTGTAESGTWTGFLDDQNFILRTRPQPGCSDGMSDKSYPIAVNLTVRGEKRSGCAERL